MTKSKSQNKTRKALSEKVLIVVTESKTIRDEIAAAVGVHTYTVQRWCKNNDPQLCIKESLDVIRKFVTVRGNGGFTIDIPVEQPHYYVD